MSLETQDIAAFLSWSDSETVIRSFSTMDERLRANMVEQLRLIADLAPVTAPIGRVLGLEPPAAEPVVEDQSARQRRQPRSTEEVEALRKRVIVLKRKKMKAADIAKELGESVHFVNDAVRLAKVAGEDLTRYSRRPDSLRKKIIRLRRRGVSPTDIATQVSQPPKYVNNVINKASAGGEAFPPLERVGHRFVSNKAGSAAAR